MRSLAIAFVMTLAAGTSLAAADSHIAAMLERIDPSERLEVICEYAAADRIGRDKNPYHPDRAVIDSISPAKMKGDLAEGTGGAFRSRGQWYQFSFHCKTTPDRLKILSFDYRVGEKIPEDKWDAYGLWR